jgi:outer membrane protein TolC
MQSRSFIASFVCATSLATSAFASPTREGFALEEALGTLFHASPTFDRQAMRAREAGASRLAASGAFDIVASAGIVGQRALWSAPFGAMTNEGYTDLSVQAGLATRTRDNIGLQISGSKPVVSSVDPRVSPDQPQVSGTISVPLLKFGRAAGWGAEERAATLHAESADAQQEDGESELAARVAEAYWRWAGSFEQVKLTRRLEALALDQLRDVDELIEQHARAPVDRLSLAAATENAKATREQAEQAMVDQRQSLWQTLGTSARTDDEEPGQELPRIPVATVDPSALSRRARALAATRPLFRAYDREIAAADVRADAARIGTRPDLTLLAQATATRVDDATATTHTELGYYGMVALQVSLPIQNRAARAALERASVARESTALSVAEGKSGIESRIDALSSALATLGRTCQERTAAAERFQLAYEAERVKFRLGRATGMDVVLAEQQFMSASLGVVADRTSYAIVLVHLLNEAGALNLAVHARDPRALVQRLIDANF